MHMVGFVQLIMYTSTLHPALFIKQEMNALKCRTLATKMFFLKAYTSARTKTHYDYN